MIDGKHDLRGSLLVDDLTKGGLALDDAVWHLHLAAEGWQPDDQFDGVDVVGNHNELGQLGL